MTICHKNFKGGIVYEKVFCWTTCAIYRNFCWLLRIGCSDPNAIVYASIGYYIDTEENLVPQANRISLINGICARCCATTNAVVKSYRYLRFCFRAYSALGRYF